MVRISFGLVGSLSFLGLFNMSSVAMAKREPYVPPDINAMTSDARSWYLKGVANAERDMNVFNNTIIPLLNEHDDSYKKVLRAQINALYKDTKEANENTHVLVPRLNGLVDSLWSWSRPPICFWSKVKLKATIWFINGKRDNKSYYLLNGGGLFCKLRAEALMKGSNVKESAAIAHDLTMLQDKILLARDELDDAAQIYVQGIAKLVDYVKDIGQNEEKIKEVVDGLKESGQKRSENILKTGDQAVEAVQDMLNAV